MSEIVKADGDNTVQTGERYRHLKRGSEYTVIGTASLQVATGTIVDGFDVVLYRGDDYPQVWARGVGEFMDGRFERIATPDQPQAVPDMVLVPREPTQAMLKAGFNASVDAYLGPRPIYAAMLAARPVLPVETPAEGLREAADLLGSLWNWPEDPNELTGWSFDNDEVVSIWKAHRIVAALASTAPAPLLGRDGSLLEAIRFVEKLHDAYAREFGVYDPSTNATEFSGAAEDVDLTYAEILEGLRALAAVPPQKAEMVGDLTAAYVAGVEKGRDEAKTEIDTLCKKAAEALAPFARMVATGWGSALADDRTMRVHRDDWPHASASLRMGDFRLALAAADSLAARASSSGEAGDE